MKRFAALAAALALLPLQPARGAAQVGAGITERIVSHTDPSKSYATFVPSGYRPGTPAPLVLLLDPRGRALIPLERMVPTAERLGYLLMSSYDSRSDEDVEPTEQAVAAMIEDAQDHFVIDTRRLYFVGFSGTARSAWLFGQRFAPYTAGIIGMGAGLPYAALPATMTATGPIPFAFYGGSGDVDFNWDELRRLDETLDGFGVRHHVDEWEGGHAWPDSAGFARALEWLDTDAVRQGLQQREEGELRRRLEGGLAYAAELEAEGRTAAAWRTYRSLARGFDGLVDSGPAEEAAARLEEGSLLARQREQIDRVLDGRRDFDREVATWLEDVQEEGDPRSVLRGIERLRVRRLQEEASSAEGRILQQAARRKLESLYAYVVFYQPEAYIAEQEWDVALAFLEVAEVIHPDDPRIPFTRARVYAQDGRVEEAFAALEHLAEAGILTADTLAGSEALSPLRGDARYTALMERLSGAATPFTR